MHTFSRLLLSKFHDNLLSFTALYQTRKFYWLLSYIGFILLMIISANVFIGNYKIRNQLRFYLPKFIIRYENSSIFTQQKQYDETIQILWYAKQPYFQGSVNLTGCEFSNCKLTENKLLLNTSDAVLFAYRDMHNNVPIKKKGHIWIIVNIESPTNDNDLSHVWGNKFDWSMTYRRDSEVLLNYMTFKRDVPLVKDYHEIFKNKTKLVAWAVSNCYSRSQRGEYVQELRKYIDVDIYGQCGKEPCPGKTMPSCHEVLSQQYKFYLGLENSMCKDYVTEKVFHTFLDNSNAIYVSRGAPNIKSMLPPKTYIDANTFKSPKELAEFLIELGSNEAEYISYLKETDKYHIDNERNYVRALCDLCKLLNTYKTQKLSWTGKNFNKWYRENTCIPQSEIKISQ